MQSSPEMGRLGYWQRLISGVFVLGSLLVTGCSMRHLLYPIPLLPVSPPPPPLEEVSIELPADIRISAWQTAITAELSERPAVLFFHGNGENLETMRRAGLFEELLALRVAFLAIDYPGYGRSQGTPSETSLKLAAETALDWLASRQPKRPLVVCGWSLGAAVATHLAAEMPDRVQGLIVVSSWTSLTEVAAHHFPTWLVRLALRERYDSLSVAGQVRSPSLVIHGAEDRIVPAALGRQLAAALTGSRWVEQSSAGHNDLLGYAEVWTEIARFLSMIEEQNQGVAESMR